MALLIPAFSGDALAGRYFGATDPGGPVSSDERGPERLLQALQRIGA